MIEIDGPDSPYAWRRLTATLLLSTIGSVGMWSGVVILPAVQAEFAVARAGASLPYTLTMLGFMAGGVVMGRLADRFGVRVPVVAGTLVLGLGYIAAAFAGGIVEFAAIYGVLIGMFGSSALFGPLIADVTHWFARRRGIAVAICACGSYFAGTVWPPVIQHFVAAVGWRPTHIGIGVFCLATMLPLSLALRRPSPGGLAVVAGRAKAGTALRPLTFGIAPNRLQTLLMIAGLSCCVAMSMPQVHIVAYCVDLGYGSARGAEMLSMMLGAGVVSRLASGWLSDRIGALMTLLLGATLQAFALALYLPFDGLVSLYVVSAVFGLSQGGIVPSYAVLARESFPAREIGVRVGLVLASTLAGMALGGWLSGALFDATGSYQAALLNGIAWNLVTITVALWLLRRARLGLAAARA